ncbi:SAP domain-containing protein [Sporobolomyces koalae]|uniref:SAP domain-containing protein n=1 Tax=Sporobolomyces koalae TaxID=500713 RepID=UPI00316AFFEE
MSEHTLESLKALTVVKLKDILAARALPVTGKKDDLIARILESSTTAEPTLDSTAQATDEPDGAGVGTVQELAPAAATAPAPTPDEAPLAAAAESGPSQEELERIQREKLDQEEHKRKLRLARFGGGDSSTTTTEDAAEIEKQKRAQRFGLETTTDTTRAESLTKSVNSLDQALGSNRRERKPKPTSGNPAPTSKSNPRNEQTVADKTGNPQAAAEPAAAAAAAVKADPELQKRLAEEEEKKKKRAARFGQPAAEPQEKKTKTA